MPTTRRMPSALVKYRTLRKKKSQHCAGKATKSDVNKAASAYVAAAVKGGQTRMEAKRKADKVVKAGCSMAGVGKTKKRKTTTKRKSTSTRGRKATGARRRAR